MTWGVSHGFRFPRFLPVFWQIFNVFDLQIFHHVVLVFSERAPPYRKFLFNRKCWRDKLKDTVTAD